MITDLKKNKKIGLILSPYGEKHAAGLGRSIFSLAESIIANDPDTIFTVFLKGSNTPNPEFKSKNFKVKRLPDHPLWLDFGLRTEEKLDVYIFFTPVMPLFVKCSNSIVVVHDLAYREIKSESIKEFFVRFVLGFVHRNALNKAKKIIAVSKYTKDTILSYYPKINPEKIVVIYNGFNSIRSKSMNESKTKIDNPYFLFVGVLKKRKNVLRLIEAFEIYKKTHNNNYNLVLVGKAGEREVEEKIKNSQFKKDIILTGYISDSDLFSLYSNAATFVFPSLIEGFGMPILEAMSIGTPVITSNIGAMREIAGEAGYLVDPYSPQSIADGMYCVVDDESLRKALILKGFERVKEFSWDKAGNKYCEIINLFI